MSGSLASAAVSVPEDDMPPLSPSRGAPPRVRAALGLGDADTRIAADLARVDELESRAKFPKLAAPPPPQTPTDPLQAFGQPAMWLAMFGSLATRRPFANAINAAGQVMQATHQMDHEAAKAAYDTWKIENENALKLAKYEQDSLKNAIAKVGVDSRAAEAMVKTHIAAFQDAALQKILEERGLAGVEAHFRHARTRLADAQSSAGGVEKTYQDAAAIYNNWTSGDPEKQAQAIRSEVEARAKIAKTPQQRMDAQQNLLLGAAISADIMSGDPARIEAAQKRGESIMHTGAGTLSAAKTAKPDKDLKWTLLTDRNGEQYLQAIGHDGKPLNQTLTGEPYTPVGASRIGTAADPKVAEARDRKQTSLEEHQDRLAQISEDRLLSTEQREARRAAELERFHKASEAGKAQALAQADRKLEATKTHQERMAQIAEDRLLSDQEKAQRTAEETERYHKDNVALARDRMGQSGSQFERRQAANELHQANIDRINADRQQTTTQRDQRLADERERHNKETEGLGRDRLDASVDQFGQKLDQSGSQFDRRLAATERHTSTMKEIADNRRLSEEEKHRLSLEETRRYHDFTESLGRDKLDQNQGQFEDRQAATAKFHADNAALAEKRLDHQFQAQQAKAAIAAAKEPTPEQLQSLAYQIAHYQEPPPSPQRLTSPNGIKLMAIVREMNPDYQAVRFPEIAKAMRDFATGRQGDQTRSMNTAIAHLDTIDELGKALKNNNVQLINRAGNAIGRQLGTTAPVTFDAAKQIVADEIAKAIIGGQNAEADRAKLQESLSRTNSPDQLLEVTKAFRTLMAGQLRSLRAQYEDATGFKKGEFAFEGKLLPETKSALGSLGAGKGSAAPAAAAQWNHTATGPGGVKLHSDDGVSWFNPDGTPYKAK
jgi:hypothetical protein